MRFAKIVSRRRRLSLWNRITSAEIPLRSYIWTGLVVKKAYGGPAGSWLRPITQVISLKDGQVSAAIRTAKPWGCWCPRASGANLASPNGSHYCRRDRAVPCNVVCRLAPAPLRPRGQLFVDHVELGCCASTAAMIAGTIVNVMSASIGLSVPDSRCCSFAIERTAHRVARVPSRAGAWPPEHLGSPRTVEVRAV